MPPGGRARGVGRGIRIPPAAAGASAVATRAAGTATYLAGAAAGNGSISSGSISPVGGGLLAAFVQYDGSGAPTSINTGTLSATWTSVATSNAISDGNYMRLYVSTDYTGTGTVIAAKAGFFLGIHVVEFQGCNQSSGGLNFIQQTGTYGGASEQFPITGNLLTGETMETIAVLNHGQAISSVSAFTLLGNTSASSRGSWIGKDMSKPGADSVSWAAAGNNFAHAWILELKA